MVKFGKRLEEELLYVGWETSYVQYKNLKKVIKQITSHEVTGDMVLAFEAREKFQAELNFNIQSASDFFVERAKALSSQALSLRQRWNDESARAGEPAPSSTPKLAEGVPLSEVSGLTVVTSEGLVGGAVMDELVLLRQEVHALRMFGLVNREAVRKILKKYHKKTSAGSVMVAPSPQGDSLDETQLLLNTGLDASHEASHTLSAVNITLDETQAAISLKSRAHGEYMRKAVEALGPSSPFGTSGGGGRGRSASGASSGSRSRRTSGAAIALDEVIVRESAGKDGVGGECLLSLPCGVTCTARLGRAEWWANPKARLKYLAMWAVGLVVVGCMVVVFVAQPGRLAKLSTLGTYASVLVAIANGANDIANSVGTSVGAKALTLTQAIVFGLIAEVLGAMTLGSLVAKTISKGIISPEVFAEQECEGVLKFGVSMVCVLAGTGLTTLLATIYGLPISASHGVIGGLIAVGLVAQGPESLGVASILKTIIAWVASPAIGAVSAAIVYWVILYAVHRSSRPGDRALMLQPLFVAITVAVAAGFIVIKGPKALKIQPVGVGVAASIAIGAAVGLLTLVVRKMRHTALGGKIVYGVSTTAQSFKKRTTTGTGGGGGTTATSNGEETTTTAATATATANNAVDTTREERAKEAVKYEVAEKPFVPLLVLSALTVAFAHGANDVGNAVGPLAAIFEASINGQIAATPEIPIWLLAIGSGGFVVGIAALGSRTIATVGGKITTLTPSKSFSVQIGAAVAVLSSTVLGLAVSTSHCLVGSVVGVGIASKIARAGGQLNNRMLLKIFIGWGVTIPLAMLVAMIFYVLIAPRYGYTAEELAYLDATNGTCY